MSRAAEMPSVADEEKLVAAPPSKITAKAQKGRHRHAAIRGRTSIRAPKGLKGALTEKDMDLMRSLTWLRRRVFSTFSNVKPNKWFALMEVPAYKQVFDEFLCLANVRVLFIVCLKNGSLRAHHARVRKRDDTACADGAAQVMQNAESSPSNLKDASSFLLDLSLIHI